MGVPLPEPVVVTVAVKVTFCPNTDGFVEELTAVAVVAASTWCAVPTDALPT